jgi:hypothetical protein
MRRFDVIFFSSLALYTIFGLANIFLLRLIDTTWFVAVFVEAWAVLILLRLYVKPIGRWLEKEVKRR